MRHYVEKELLPTPFETLSALELDKLFQNLTYHLQLHPRHSDHIIFKADEPQTLPELIGALKEKGDWETANKLQSLHTTLCRWGGDYNKAKAYFTSEEWQTLSQVVFLPSPSRQIEMHERAFFNQLSRHLKNPKLHPFQIASFIHYGIQKIRPLEDGNGRVARLFTNIYLMQQGLLPLVIFERNQYVALFDAPNYEQSFCAFIRGNMREIEMRLRNYELPRVLEFAHGEGFNNNLIYGSGLGFAF